MKKQITAIKSRQMEREANSEKLVPVHPMKLRAMANGKDSKNNFRRIISLTAMDKKSVLKPKSLARWRTFHIHQHALPFRILKIMRTRLKTLLLFAGKTFVQI